MDFLIIRTRQQLIFWLVMFFSLSYLSLYIFYRNSVLLLKNSELKFAVDRCERERISELYAKDFEVKLIQEKQDSSWDVYSGMLVGRRDRRAVHFHVVRGVVDKCEGCELYEADVPSDGQFECVALSGKPETPICVYSDDEDKKISTSIRRQGHWQKDSIERLLHWLARDPELGFVDINCYIGVFALSVARAERNVLAVDQEADNLMRLRQSVRLAGVQDKVTLLRNGISDVRGVVELTVQATNRKITRFKQPRSTSANRTKYEDHNLNSVRTIYLDDLLPFCKFQKAILRIGANGLVHRALSKAQLFFSHLTIPVIIMDWEKIKVLFWLPLDNEDRRLVEEMIEFLLSLDYTPLGWDKHTLFVQIWDLWPSDILWVHKTFSF